MQRDEFRQKQFEALYTIWREKFRLAIMASSELKSFASDIFDSLTRYGRGNLEYVNHKSPLNFEQFITNLLGDVCDELRVFKGTIFTSEITDRIGELGNQTLDAFLESKEFITTTDYDREGRFRKKDFGSLDFVDPRQRNK